MWQPTQPIGFHGSFLFHGFREEPRTVDRVIAAGPEEADEGDLRIIGHAQEREYRSVAMRHGRVRSACMGRGVWDDARDSANGA